MANFFTNISFDWFWDILDFLVELLFGWINIPQMPTSLTDTISTFLDLIFNNLTLASFFISPFIIKIIIPIVLFLLNFKWIYHAIIWLIKKIPFLSIE